MILKGENNPFKFMNADAVKAGLFERDQEGFLDASAAVEEIFADIKQHQIAVLGGMQHALVGVFNRFDPRNIEDEMAEKKTMSVLAAGGRKAAAWDAFEEMYTRMQKQLSDYDNSFFMADFREGYSRRSRK